MGTFVIEMPIAGRAARGGITRQTQSSWRKKVRESIPAGRDISTLTNRPPDGLRRPNLATRITISCLGASNLSMAILKDFSAISFNLSGTFPESTGPKGAVQSMSRP
jgi:hypothetical protein